MKVEEAEKREKEERKHADTVESQLSSLRSQLNELRTRDLEQLESLQSASFRSFFLVLFVSFWLFVSFRSLGGFPETIRQQVAELEALTVVKQQLVADLQSGPSVPHNLHPPLCFIFVFLFPVGRSHAEQKAHQSTQTTLSNLRQQLSSSRSLLSTSTAAAAAGASASPSPASLLLSTPIRAAGASNIKESQAEILLVCCVL